MSLFDSIMKFLSSLFGKKEVQTVEQASVDAKTEEPLNRQRMLTDPVCAIPVNDSSFVTGTRMKWSMFDFMVINETETVKEQVIAEMQKMDAIGEYPYIITTAKAQYHIHRSSNDYGYDLTETMGTSYHMKSGGK